MILIYPPCAKPSEPPPGLARLCGALRYHGIFVRAVDMNLEGFEYLYAKQPIPTDLWGKRALNKKEANRDLLQRVQGYENTDRYKNAVLDITKVLSLASEHSGSMVSLANYKHDRLSPVKTGDLETAAENPRDNIFFPYFEKRFASLAHDRHGLDTVGFSLNFLNQALTTFAMIGYLKQNYPSTRIILGGGLVTTWMRKPGWENPFPHLVDTMIDGDGEGPLLEMYNITETKRHYCPDYRDFEHGAYLSPGLILPYSASGGCYWRKCTFCPEMAEKNPYRPIPVRTVIDQLNLLQERHKPSLIHIVDNAVSPALLKGLASQPLGTPWYAFSRMTPHLADLDFCRALKTSGCTMLQLGLESGDPQVLGQMNKGLDLALASRVLSTLNQAGITTYVYLLFGTPAENEEAAGKTMSFVVDHSDMIGFLNIAVFNLPYFAENSADLDTRLFYEGDLSLYREFSHPLGWDRSAIRHFLEKEFKKHPKISEIVKRDPPVFSSNHASFFRIHP